MCGVDRNRRRQGAKSVDQKLDSTTAKSGNSPIDRRVRNEPTWPSTQSRPDGKPATKPATSTKPKPKPATTTMPGLIDLTDNSPTSPKSAPIPTVQAEHAVRPSQIRSKREDQPSPQAPSVREDVRNRNLVAAAVLVGVIVGLLTFSINRLGTEKAEATAVLILDEDQVTWPFYRAAHELAASFVRQPTTLAEAAKGLADPTEAISLDVERSSDLSVVRLVAIAQTPETALGLVEQGSALLIENSERERQRDLVELQARTELVAQQLEQKQSDLQTTLDNSEIESEQIRLRSDLRQVSDELNDQRSKLVELQSEIDRTASAYRFVRSEKTTSGTQTALASLAAGIGAAAGALLLLSFFANPSHTADTRGRKSE